MRIIPVAVFFLMLLGSVQQASAAYMSPISDLIANSQPSTSTPHIITFTVTNAVPVSGTITITPEGAFTLPAGFDFTDVDFAVASGGPFVERNLAATADAANDGVFVVSGATPSITITLNSTSNVPAGAKVRIVLGTSATQQVQGTVSPVNASTPGSYRIKVQTANGGTNIDDAKAMIVVLEPVSISFLIPYLSAVLFNGLPSGTIPAGSNRVELTLETSIPAYCRYATSSGVTYGAMTHQFSTIGNQFFYTVVSGHQDNTTYNYYVRCTDAATQTLPNLSDYVITFTLGPTPTVTTSDGTTQTISTEPSGAGGSGGAGSFPGGSSVLFLSTVTVTGKAPAGSSVTVLRDGKSELTVQASALGTFSAKIPGLERGTYTFVVFATDGKGRKTSRFSSTLSLVSGTNNQISNVLLSPTVAPDAEEIDVGQPVRLSGLGIPGSTVSIEVASESSGGAAAAARQYTASSSAEGTNAGAWEFTVPAKDIARGTYSARVKTVLPGASSMQSGPAYFGYGEALTKKADTGNRSDINRDGKVNLVDFSILLTHWNDFDEDSDINSDGKVNLADFSIMLFNWTG